MTREISVPEGMSVAEYVKNTYQAHALALQADCWEYLESAKATYSQKADYLKYAMKAGDLEPKQTLTAQGAGFSIRIVMGDSDEDMKTVSGVTIDAVMMQPDDSPPIYMSPSLITDNLASLQKSLSEDE